MLKKICSVLVTASLVFSQTAAFAQTQNTAETPGSVTVKENGQNEQKRYVAYGGHLWQVVEQVDGRLLLCTDPAIDKKLEMDQALIEKDAEAQYQFLNQDFLESFNAVEKAHLDKVTLQKKTTEDAQKARGAKAVKVFLPNDDTVEILDADVQKALEKFKAGQKTEAPEAAPVPSVAIPEALEEAPAPSVATPEALEPAPVPSVEIPEAPEPAPAPSVATPEAPEPAPAPSVATPEAPEPAPAPGVEPPKVNQPEETEEAILGDVNADLKVNILDAQQIAKDSTSDKEMGGIPEQTGDVNGDAQVNIIDAQQIAQNAVEPLDEGMGTKKMVSARAASVMKSSALESQHFAAPDTRPEGLAFGILVNPEGLEQSGAGTKEDPYTFSEKKAAPTPAVPNKVPEQPEVSEAPETTLPFTPFSKEELENPRLNNVEQAFDQLSTAGYKTREPSAAGFPSDLITTTKNHIQGLGYYGDYTIINVNGDGSPGKIFIYDQGGMVQTLVPPQTKSFHTSGMQVVGDMLIMMNGLHGDPDSYILMVDLRPLKEGQEAVMLPRETGPSMTGACVGATNYTAADGTERLILIGVRNQCFESVIPEDGVSFNWVERQYDGPNLKENQNIALVTDVNNQVYLVAFASEASQQGSITDLIDTNGFDGLNFDDRLELYKVDVHSNPNGIKVEFLKRKDVQAYDDDMLVFGSHFRYGATLTVDSPEGFSVHTTRRAPGNAHFNILGSLGSDVISALFGGNTLPITTYTAGQSYFLENKSGTVSKMDVTYVTKEGEQKTQTTNNVALGENQDIRIPIDAKDIRLDFYVSTGSSWKPVKTLEYKEANGNARRYKITGTVFNPTLHEGVVLGEGIQYQIKVKTGTAFGAGTDSDVYIRLVGDQGTTDEVLLNYGMTNQFNTRGNPFETKGYDVGVFNFNQDVGKIKRIEVRTDRSGAGADWLLDAIEVVPMYNTTETQTKKFDIHQWIVNDTWTSFSNTAEDSSQYRLKINTGNVKGAGTDSDIYVKLTGTKGETNEVEVTALYNGNAFEKGTSHSVVASFDQNVGEIQKITVRSDMSGVGADWFLDSVQVVPVWNNQTQDGEKTFDCKEWIVNKNPHTYSLDQNAITRYRMTVKTGKLSWWPKGEGTDADIYVRLIGDKGQTNEVEITSLIPGNALERGDTDTFTVNFENAIGNVKKIQVRSDMSGVGPDWYLERIDVQPLFGNKDVGKNVRFAFNQWIDSKKVYEK